MYEINKLLKARSDRTNLYGELSELDRLCPHHPACEDMEARLEQLDSLISDLECRISEEERDRCR